MDQPSIARSCPKCGSASYTRVKVERLIAFTDDRMCDECGTRYTPPTPAWAAIVFIVVGCLLSGIGVFMIVKLMNLKQVDLECSYLGAVMLILGGAAPLIYGIRSLTRRPSSEAVVRPIPAPLSKTVQTAMHGSGVVILLSGVLSGLVWLAGTQGPLRGGSPLVALYGVAMSLAMGAAMLGMPAKIQQQREKRLQEYQASAPPGAPPPVEIPRPPDVVFMSMMFGILSLISVVFGPAAIVCGIVALARGHLKGLIGMVLGVVTLIGWGLALGHLLQG